ncbi:MAG TPA: GNAT family N-acetyltransferase [Candidatus Binataceae bacterium]
MRIINLRPENETLIRQVAAMLVEGFRQMAPDAWPDMESALTEVRESLCAGRLSRVAVDGDGVAIAWIGGIRQYSGHVWELHPMVVRRDQQGRGIGRALVEDFEQRVIERGAQTILLGTDDELGQTSLGNVDLYTDLGDRIRDIRNLGRHPYEFYQKLGFAIVGVLPDANGPGKPDIFMAKRVGK